MKKNASSLNSSKKLSSSENKKKKDKSGSKSSRSKSKSKSKSKPLPPDSDDELDIEKSIEKSIQKKIKNQKPKPQAKKTKKIPKREEILIDNISSDDDDELDIEKSIDKAAYKKLSKARGLKKESKGKESKGKESKEKKEDKEGKKPKSKSKSLSLFENPDENPNRILYVKITQTSIIKLIMEIISGVISECCIVFFPPDAEESGNNEEENEYFEENNLSDGTKSKTKIKTRNTGGIRIFRLSEDSSVLIKLSLNADRFEQFICKEPKITIGVDMSRLHLLLKMVSDNDPIVLYMNARDRSFLYIRSLAEQNEMNNNIEETNIDVNLLEIPNNETDILHTKFQNIISVPSSKFHSICKNLNNCSTFVEIQATGNEVQFSGKCEGGKVTKTYKDNNNANSKNKSDIFQGTYDLKNLMRFSKCNKLCSEIQIYLKNDFPLVLVISITTLGKMYVFLPPIENSAQQ